jgi:hypothetical protein
MHLGLIGQLLKPSSWLITEFINRRHLGVVGPKRLILDESNSGREILSEYQLLSKN